MLRTKPPESSSVVLLFPLKFLYFQKIIVIYNINPSTLVYSLTSFCLLSLADIYH